MGVLIFYANVGDTKGRYDGSHNVYSRHKKKTEKGCVEVKRKFGIDIDGTVTSTSALLPFINKEFGLNIRLQDVINYDLSRLVDIPRGEFWSWFAENEEEIYKQVKVADGVAHTLSNWAGKYGMYYISARRGRYLQVTEEWFSKYKLPYDSIELLGNVSKADEINR